MDRCNELCTKEITGTCALCEALAERDRFEQFWFRGGLIVAGLRTGQHWGRVVFRSQSFPVVIGVPGLLLLFLFESFTGCQSCHHVSA